MKITIDGKKVEAKRWDTVLTAARRAGIAIPSLCQLDSLENVGACRLCMVEVNHPHWRGAKLVTACEYPVESGLEVITTSEEVLRLRRANLDLLLARAPESRRLQQMSAEMGLEQSGYVRPDKGTACILCMLCTRVCEKLGCNAIAPAGRGLDKRIDTPFGGYPDTCIGCGACAAICPVDCIEMTDTAKTRTIWGRTFEFVKCAECGTPVITVEYRDYAIAHRSLPADYYNECSDCKRRKLAVKFAKVGG